MPIHVGAMQFAAGAIVRERDGHEPGDIYMINDPYLGGAAPGGYVTKATEIQQEGLRSAASNFTAGASRKDLLQLILDNVRPPTQRLGDLHAQVASLKAGETEVHRLIETFGAETLDTAVEQLERRSARLVRETTASAVYIAFKHAFPETPMNAGVF